MEPQRHPGYQAATSFAPVTADMPSWMERFRTLIAPVAQLVAVLVATGTVIVWGYRLQDKVDRLEAQVQAILTSGPTQAPSNSSVNPSSAGSLPTACANLADRAAMMAQSILPGPLKDIRQLMVDLGCMQKTQ